MARKLRAADKRAIYALRDQFNWRSLRYARCAQRLTQDQASEMIGVSRPTLVGLETGATMPSPSTILLAALFYVPESLSPELRTLAEEFRDTRR